MTQSDKLTMEQINQLILVEKSAKSIAYLCQLRDTMREVERLRVWAKDFAEHLHGEFGDWDADDKTPSAEQYREIMEYLRNKP